MQIYVFVFEFEEFNYKCTVRISFLKCKFEFLREALLVNAPRSLHSRKLPPLCRDLIFHSCSSRKLAISRPYPPALPLDQESLEHGLLLDQAAMGHCQLCGRGILGLERYSSHQREEEGFDSHPSCHPLGCLEIGRKETIRINYAPSD
ncbi:uncharacterized protein LOC131148622 [Malania oleifera]|uniref:uncharacterized protein LOC131148622 n=1 Tax=Malania oleifera TaxID=397392 RepID=UPI0025ADE5C1|nr:uncharacterized protein LOC131148622 [Malania oleifera]